MSVLPIPSQHPTEHDKAGTRNKRHKGREETCSNMIIYAEKPQRIYKDTIRSSEWVLLERSIQGQHTTIYLFN